jgi:hypothetical protein
MTADDLSQEDARQDGGGGAMDKLSMEARIEARMLSPKQKVTDVQRDKLLAGLEEYRQDHRIGGKPMPLTRLATYIGVSSSVLTEVVNGKYAGDTDRVLRQIDEFLAREEQQGKRPDFREFVKIKITEKIVTAINEAVMRRSIGVIIGEPGDSKSEHAKWYCTQREGVVLITSDECDYDRKFIIDELHRELKLGTHCPHTRDKKREIVGYLQTHKNTVIIVDEAQKLTTDALEILRAFHDKSDPAGRKNVPVILFGDEDFYKIIIRTRGGQRTPLSPQITRRMYPVISIEFDGMDRDEEGKPIPGSVFTYEDIERIVQNQKLRLFRPEAIGFAVRLANEHGHGRLGLAIRIMETAVDIKAEDKVSVADMREALSLYFGPSEAKLILEKIEIKTPRRVAAAG